MTAVLKGHKDCIIKMGAQGYRVDLVLKVAVKNGNIEMCEYALYYLTKKELDKFYFKNEYLKIAIFNKKLNTFKLCLKYYKLNYNNYKDLIEYSIDNESYECLNYLLMIKDKSLTDYKLKENKNNLQRLSQIIRMNGNNKFNLINYPGIRKLVLYIKHIDWKDGCCDCTIYNSQKLCCPLLDIIDEYNDWINRVNNIFIKNTTIPSDIVKHIIIKCI
jgi:hypothetical protein